MAVLQTPVLEEELSEIQDHEITLEDYPFSPQLTAILKRYRAATAKPPQPDESFRWRDDAFLKWAESGEYDGDDRMTEKIIKEIRESRTKGKEAPVF